MIKRMIAALAALAVCCSHAIAADVAISGLPAASSVTGTNELPANQSGTTRKVTAAQIAAYVESGVTKADVGLGNVDNTSDAAKPVSTATQTALDLKAPLASPALTGTPTAPTAAAGTNTTQVATTAGIVAERTATAALTGKTIDGDLNTLQDIGNSSLTNSAVTINGFGLSLGGTASLTDIGAAGGGANNYTGNQQIDAAEPRYLFNETDQATNEKLWDLDLATKILCLRSRTDADAVGIDAFCITRGTGTAISQVAINSNLRQSAAEIRYIMNETGQSADEGLWDWDIDAKTMTLRTRTDADSAGRTLMQFVRGTGVASAQIRIGDSASTNTIDFLGSGLKSFSGSIDATGGAVSARNFTVTAAGTCTNGINQPTTNTVGICTNSAARGTVNATGQLIWNSGVHSAGTKFTTSGCSISSTTGGATAGTFTLGANSCTAVVTMAGATGATATNGWTCQAHDRTAPTILIGGESSSTTTTASFTIPASAGTTDVISFSCVGY